MTTPRRWGFPTLQPDPDPDPDPGQVTHYYFADCLYYTPLYSNARLGEYFLRDLVDLRTGEPVVASHDGTRFEREDIGAGRLRLQRGHARPATELASAPADPARPGAA